MAVGIDIENFKSIDRQLDTYFCWGRFSTYPPYLQVENENSGAHIMGTMNSQYVFSD